MKKTNLIWGIIIILTVCIIAYLGYGYYKKVTQTVQNPIVTMEVEGYGTVKMELYPDMAPNTVAHFIKKIQEGYYDGLTFHRTIPDFMIQGGDKDGTGSGTLDYAIPGEFIANGYKDNKLKHERGVLSMARGDYSNLGEGLTNYTYNSAGTQFFIMTQDATSLDGYYAAFGKVIEGMDVIDAIANTEVLYRTENLAEDEEAPKDENGNTIASDRPVNPPVITKMTVDTFGVDYGEPTVVAPFDYSAWIYQQYGIDVDNIEETEE